MTTRLTGVEHDLKTWPVYWVEVAMGRKPWELRVNDRGYRVGDVLHLREWDPHRSYYTGRACRRVVTYMLQSGSLLPAGLVIMSLAPVPPTRVPRVSGRVTAVTLALAVLALVLGWWLR